MKCLCFFSLIFIFTFSGYAEEKATQKESVLPVKVLLITASELKDSWKKFADWKTQTGRSTKIITISEIEKSYKGKDLQEKIRQCCLKHINENDTQYIILGGDSTPKGGNVPDRDTIHKTMRLYHPDIPTDSYYTSEKNWDTNKNGIYGEWPEDRDDTIYAHSKASIGRIPVRTKADVAAYTDKIIAYESKYPKTKFAEKMVYTCPVPGAQPKLGTSRKTIQKTWDKGEMQFFFDKKTPWDEKVSGDFDLTPNNWVNLINKKETGKMHIHGHGFLPVWVLEHHKTVDQKHVDALKNDNAYLTMTTVSCFTGQYDGKKDPSITESMLRAKDKGAVIIIAPAREGVPAFHNPPYDYQLMVLKGKMDGTTQLLTTVWEQGLKHNLSFGEALRRAKDSMKKDANKTSSYHYVLSEINLLGDPTLSMRSASPSDIALECPKTLSTSDKQLVVKTDKPNVKVCIWKKGELYKTVQTDDKGVCTIDLKLKEKGTLHVSAFGPNLNMTAQSIEVSEAKVN